MRQIVFSPFLLASCIISASQLAAQDEQSEYKSLVVRNAVMQYTTSVSQLDRYFRSAIDRMSEKYVAERKKLRDKLLVVIEDERKKATVGDDLDEAVKLQETYKNYESAEYTPPAGPTTSDTQDEVRSLKMELAKLKRENASLRRGHAADSAKATQELQAFLIGTRWEWNNGDLVFTFGNGLCWISDNPNEKIRWQAISPNTVAIIHPNGKKGIITFIDQRTHFIRVDTEGYRCGMLVGKQ